MVSESAGPVPFPCTRDSIRYVGVCKLRRAVQSLFPGAATRFSASLRKPPMTGFFSVQNLGGLAVGVLGLFMFYDAVLKHRRWLRAEGTIVAVTRTLGIRTPQVEFKDAQGQARLFAARFSFRRREPIGAKVKVMYDPGFEQEPEVVSVMNNFIAPLATAAFGFWFSAFALFGRG